MLDTAINQYGGIPLTENGTPFEPLNSGRPASIDCIELTEGDRTAVLVDPRSRKTRAVRYLWFPWIRKDGTTILAGPGGARKSTFAAYIAAEATNGRLLDKKGNANDACRVLYVTQGEDDLDSVLIPRIEAQGADLDLFRVFQIRVPAHDGLEVDAATGAQDLNLLRRMVAAYKPGLVVLDPLSLLIDGDINSYRDAQPALVACNELSQLGDGCAVLGIHHWNRAGTFTGSQKFQDTARVFMEIAPDPRDANSSIVSVTKANNSNKPSMRLTAGIVPFTTDDGEMDDVQIIAGVQPSDITVDDIRGARADGEDVEDADDCGAWLLDFLHKQGGAALAREVLDAGMKAHFSESQIKRAKNRLARHVRSEKDPKIFQGRWTWKLVNKVEEKK